MGGEGEKGTPNIEHRTLNLEPKETRSPNPERSPVLFEARS